MKRDAGSPDIAIKGKRYKKQIPFTFHPRCPPPIWPKVDEPWLWTDADVRSAMTLNMLELTSYGHEILPSSREEKCSELIQALDLATFKGLPMYCSFLDDLPPILASATFIVWV